MTSLFRIITYIPFSPTDLSDCIVWLEADDLTGLNDDPVSVWESKGTQTFNFIQPNLTYQPTLKISTINGHNTIHFNGTNQFLYNTDNLSLLKNKDNLTSYIVYKVTNAVQQYVFMVSDGLAGSRYPRFGVYSSGNVFVTTAKQLDGDPDFELFGNMIGNPNTFYMSNSEASWQNDYIKSYIDGYFNGDEPTMDSVGPTSNTNSINILAGVGELNSPSTTLYPSSSLLPASPSYYNGDIAEIVLFDRILSSDDKEKMNRYLTLKYGIYYMQLAPSTSLYPATDLYLPW